MFQKHPGDDVVQRDLNRNLRTVRMCVSVCVCVFVCVWRVCCFVVVVVLVVVVVVGEGCEEADLFSSSAPFAAVSTFSPLMPTQAELSNSGHCCPVHAGHPEIVEYERSRFEKWQKYAPR